MKWPTRQNPFHTQTLDARYTIARDTHARWVEETDPEIAERHTGHTARYLGRALRERRLFFSFSMILCIIAVFWVRMFVLNQIHGDYYSALAEQNQLRARLIVPERGRIRDHRGIIIAENVPNFQLHAIPADLPTSDDARRAIFATLSILNIDEARADTWNARIAEAQRDPLRARQPLVLEDHVQYASAVLFETMREKPIGVYLTLQPIRAYPRSQTLPSLSHLLGYLGKIFADEYGTLDQDEYTFADMVGKQGIEIFYERLLRGRRGVNRYAVDARGTIQQLVSQELPTNGTDIVLTIDVSMQEALEQILARVMRTQRAHRGAAIVLEPQSGALRALVSLPAYDNNEFAQGITPAQYAALRDDPGQPLFPRAIAGEYPSGSTIKPIVAAAALAEGIITPQTSLLSTGGIAVGPWFFPDWKKGGHGSTNVTTAIAESVNTFFYIIAGGYREREGLGILRLVNYAQRFGLGEKLGIDLPGERRGLLPTPEWKERTKREQWYIGDTYHAAIGQGDVLVTPLQVATWMAVFANGGTLIRPHLLEATIDSNGRRRDVPITVIRNQVVDPSIARTVRQALRATVTRGSAQRLLNLPVTSAGKTGTAEWSSKKKPHAWFTVFAPYEKPEIVVTVLIEEGEEGARSALTVAHDFLQWYFRQK